MNIHAYMTNQELRFDGQSGDISQFKSSVEQALDNAQVPLATSIEKNIPIYDGKFVDKAAKKEDLRQQLLGEWARNFEQGSGIIVIKAGFDDHVIIDIATEIFEDIIEDETKSESGSGDHFAKAGANDRIWNALEKHCLFDAGNFASYYASNAIALPAEAWLGPHYQLTAQVNRVNPGGEAQKPHRDYHLGFMTTEQAAQYPAHIHRLSPYLTLQGAVAHCDMPIESGPTQLLPFSQRFNAGYMAFKRDEFQAYFAENYVQLELKKGDLLFFNPAVMHAAGDNKSSDIHRMANLLQLSSAFGRAMETIDRKSMSQALFPVLASLREHKKFSEAQIDNVIAACAEGYSFPTNLDNDPPIGGLAPKTQAQFLKQAVSENWTASELEYALVNLVKRQNSRSM